MKALRLRRGDKGDVFLELFAVAAVIGIALVAVLAGVSRNVLLPEANRKQSTAGTAAREYAEAIKTVVAAGGYVDCGTADSYGSPSGFSPPSGYLASVGEMEYWNGAGWQHTCAPDTGLQRITVQVRSDDNRASQEVTVELRKP